MAKGVFLLLIDGESCCLLNCCKDSVRFDIGKVKSEDLETCVGALPFSEDPGVVVFVGGVLL